jgi:hypothetical protein
MDDITGLGYLIYAILLMIILCSVLSGLLIAVYL